MEESQILPLTGRELDAAVAEALGWRIETSKSNPLLTEVYEPEAEEWCFACVTEQLKHNVLPIPACSTDPASADLVRQEIERRGWPWATGTNWLGYMANEPYSATVWVQELAFRPFEAGGDSHFEALCRAFLLAHHTTEGTDAPTTTTESEAA